PAKSAAYNSRLPSNEIDRWPISLPPNTRSQNLFFTLLDEAFPASIRNRALYMGSIFRIGFEIIYMTACASLSIFALAVVAPSLGPVRHADSGVHHILYATAAVHVAAVPLALLLRYHYYRTYRENTSRGAAGRVWNELRAE